MTSSGTRVAQPREQSAESTGASEAGSGQDQCAHASPGAAQLLCWAHGRDTRAPRPGGTRTMLLTLPPGQTLDRGVRRTPTCFQASSFLQGPPEDGRFFYVAGGSLWAQTPTRARSAVTSLAAAPTRLDGHGADLRIELLLAYERNAAVTTLLVMARPRADATAPPPRGSQGRNAATESVPWLLQVSADAITAAEPAADLPALRGRDAFFAAFHAPRCKHEDRQCLRINAVANPMPDADEGEDATLYTIDVEARRGASGRLLQDLGAARAVDAAWGTGPDGDQVHLLVECDDEREP